jgi:hypothetical protein
VVAVDPAATMVAQRPVGAARRVVFTWTPFAGAFWFVRDYLHRLLVVER